MNLQLSIIVFFLALVATSCSSVEETNLKDIEWLLGSWKVDNGASIEEWTKINDNLFKGRSYRVEEADTVVMETVELVKKDKYLFYIPAVKNQNEGAAIPFRLISKKGNKLIFENKAHDFPQRIEYSLQKEGLIQAWIKGIEKDKGFRKIGFLLEKIY